MPVGPHAGGVDHVLGAQLELAAAQGVAAQHPGGAAAALDQALDLDRVGAHRAEALGLAQHREHQPRVVGLAVVEQVRRGGLARRQGGQHLQRLGGVHGAVALGAPVLGVAALAAPARAAALAAHHVVEVQAHARLAVGVAALERGDQQRQRLDQVRGQVDHQLALHQRLAHQAEVEVLQVAQAAVHQLRGPAGGARRVVALLDQRDAVAARGRVQGHAGAGDAAADDHHVELVRLHRGQGVGARDHGRKLTYSLTGERSGARWSWRCSPRWIRATKCSSGRRPSAAAPAGVRRNPGVRQ